MKELLSHLRYKVFQEEVLMFKDPIFTAFIIYVAINAFLLLRVWYYTVKALIEYFRRI